MTDKARIIITYHKKIGTIQVKAGGFKIGEERLIIKVLDICSDYFKSDKFRKTLLDSLTRQLKDDKKFDRPPVIRKGYKWPTLTR